MLTIIKRWLTGILGITSGMLLVLFANNLGTAQAQSGSCELVNQLEQLHVYYAPMTNDAQLRDVLPQGAPYTMIGISSGFFWIEYGEGERGWINFHTRTNGVCDAFQVDDTDDIPLTEFPTTCHMTIHQETTGYSDSSLSQQHPGFGTYPAGTYPVVDITDHAVGLMGAVSMSGGYIDINAGTLSGHCHGTLQLATTLDNARVWTQPDTTTGTVIITLEAGIEVGILSDPISGKIQAELMGDFVKVIRGNVMGWVWVERLQPNRSFTTQQPVITTATTGEDTRIWSAPDAKSGEVITSLIVGTEVHIIGDTVTGNIQLESDLQGAWYPVQFGGTTGWIYEGRLIILDI